MADYLNQPHSHPLRRALFQLHLWLGLIIGSWLAVVCISGSILVFRSDLQRAAFPQLLASDHHGAPADIAALLDTLRAAYPGKRIAGIESPTRYRQTYLAYVVDEGRFRTILADPATGRVLGELPQDSWVATVQSLHFNLLLGKTGKALNQIAALGLACLVITGAVIWWQGARRWPRGLHLRGGPWPGLLRNLHSATGAWAWLMVLMISVTACSFMFPREFRSLVAVVAPAVRRVPPSIDERREGDIALEKVIRVAGESNPGEYIARVVVPSERDAVYQITFARERPTPMTPAAQVTRYFDRYSGEQVGPTTTAAPAELIIAWSTALHVGNFAGNGTRITWAVIGTVPPLLFFTGALLWWRRVVRPWRYPKRPVM